MSKATPKKIGPPKVPKQPAVKWGNYRPPKKAKK